MTRPCWSRWPSPAVTVSGCAWPTGTTTARWGGARRGALPAGELGAALVPGGLGPGAGGLADPSGRPGGAGHGDTDRPAVRPAEPPEGGDLATYVSRRVSAAGWRYHARVRVHPPSRSAAAPGRRRGGGGGRRGDLPAAHRRRHPRDAGRLPGHAGCRRRGRWSRRCWSRTSATWPTATAGPPGDPSGHGADPLVSTGDAALDALPMAIAPDQVPRRRRGCPSPAPGRPRPSGGNAGGEPSSCRYGRPGR